MDKEKDNLVAQAEKTGTQELRSNLGATGGYMMMESDSVITTSHERGSGAEKKPSVTYDYAAGVMRTRNEKRRFGEQPSCDLVKRVCCFNKVCFALCIYVIFMITMTVKLIQKYDNDLILLKHKNKSAAESNCSIEIVDEMTFEKQALTWNGTLEKMKADFKNQVYGFLGQPCDIAKYAQNTLRFWNGFIQKDEIPHDNETYQAIEANLSIFERNSLNLNNTAVQQELCFTGGLMECRLNTTANLTNHYTCQCMRHPMQTAWSETPIPACYPEAGSTCHRFYEIEGHEIKAESHSIPEEARPKSKMEFDCIEGSLCHKNFKTCEYPLPKPERGIGWSFFKFHDVRAEKGTIG